MLELEEALKQILAAIPSPETEGVSLSEASGRFLGARVCAAVDLPVFDNSAMDGFAVRGSDLASASPDHPVRLRMIGRVPAGQSFSGGPIPSLRAIVYRLPVATRCGCRGNARGHQTISRKHG